MPNKPTGKKSLGSFNPAAVIHQATALKNTRPTAADEQETDPLRPSAVNFHESTWILLQDVARARARKARRGRPSVSALLEELVLQNRAKLERELKVDA